MMTPSKIEIRPKKPRTSTVIKTIAEMVMIAVQGCTLNSDHAVGARFRPISATTAPVTTGGISTLIHFEPKRSTSRPTMNSTAPAAKIPPRAAAIPPCALAAMTGEMKAKLLPV